MADNSGGGGSAPFLAFLVGGLLVAVVVLGFFMFNGRLGGPNAGTPSHVTLNIKPPTPSQPSTR